MSDLTIECPACEGSGTITVSHAAHDVTADAVDEWILDVEHEIHVKGYVPTPQELLARLREVLA